MDNHNAQRLLATLLSLGMVPTLAYAEESSEVPVAAEAVPSVNEFELGVGYVGEDSYHFGRYNGLIDQGPYIIGDVKAKKFTEDGGFWGLRGTDLGLESRYLRFDAGVQGKQQFFVVYDEFPDYEDNTASTPFTNAGSTQLLLPNDYDYNNLDSYLLPFDQETSRKYLGVGGKVFFKSRWELSGSVSRETMEGTEAMGTAMGPSIPDNIFKWTNGALIPQPVDFENNKLNVNLNYNGKDTQMKIAYNASIFSNDNDYLEWTDPLPDPSSKKVDIYRPGRISMEPGNQMHQLTGLVTYALSPINRLTALASVSRLTQDEKFLPYSVNDTVDSLPVNSLDGEVWLYRGQVKFDSRPTRKLRLSAKYTYDERDNDIDQNSYDYVIADTISAGEVVGTPFPVTNNPLSYTRNKVNLDANYYFNSMFSLRADYQYLDVHRSYDDNVRKNTRENTLNARLRMRANSELNVDFYGGVSRRSGSQYYTRLNENPDLRVFYMADVDREEVGINITYTPLDPLTFSLKTDYWNNDYDKTEIGLKQSTQRAATFDASYRFNENLSTHMFYSYEESDTNQAGENPEAEKGTLDVWDTEMTDQIQSFGLGFNLTALDKWDGGLDWVYTRSRGVIDGYGYTAPIDLDSNITGPFTPIEVQPFPDLRTSLSSLQLWAKYHYSEKIAYKLSYWYESYQTDNWGIDDLTNDSVKQYLLLGQSELDYNQNVLGVSVIMQF